MQQYYPDEKGFAGCGGSRPFNRSVFCIALWLRLESRRFLPSDWPVHKIRGLCKCLPSGLSIFGKTGRPPIRVKLTLHDGSQADRQMRSLYMMSMPQTDSDYSYQSLSSLLSIIDHNHVRL
jgi:hypothetical protein